MNNTANVEKLVNKMMLRFKLFTYITCMFSCLSYNLQQWDLQFVLHKKCSFPLRIFSVSSVNMNKSAGNGGFGKLMENLWKT